MFVSLNVNFPGLLELLKAFRWKLFIT